MLGKERIALKNRLNNYNEIFVMNLSHGYLPSHVIAKNIIHDINQALTNKKFHNDTKEFALVTARLFSQFKTQKYFSSIKDKNLLLKNIFESLTKQFLFGKQNNAMNSALSAIEMLLRFSYDDVLSKKLLTLALEKFCILTERKEICIGLLFSSINGLLSKYDKSLITDKNHIDMINKIIVNAIKHLDSKQIDIHAAHQIYTMINRLILNYGDKIRIVPNLEKRLLKSCCSWLNLIEELGYKEEINRKWLLCILMNAKVILKRKDRLNDNITDGYYKRIALMIYPLLDGSCPVLMATFCDLMQTFIHKAKMTFPLEANLLLINYIVERYKDSSVIATWLEYETVEKIIDDIGCEFFNINKISHTIELNSEIVNVLNGRKNKIENHSLQDFRSEIIEKKAMLSRFNSIKSIYRNKQRSEEKLEDFVKAVNYINTEFNKNEIYFEYKDFIIENLQYNYKTLTGKYNYFKNKNYFYPLRNNKKEESLEETSEVSELKPSSTVLYY